MRQRPSAFDDPPALDPTTLLCLEIDIELRDAWELLDQAPDIWDDLHLAITASAMRVAYDRGRRQGETAGRAAGYEDGYEDGHQEGYDSAFADAPA
jgi:flagellar biosynthesis/type III secretory pathway protein FliH